MKSSLLDLDVFLVVDTSQAELRALAELSNDPILIKQFQEAALDRKNPLKDIHCLVGHMLTGWSVERIASDKKTRRLVKNCHFSVVFGVAEEGVYPYIVSKIRAVDGLKADLTGITPKSCIALHRRYFVIYKGVKRFIDNQRAFADKNNYVESLFGFRRHIVKENSGRASYWGNQSINSPVQSTAHTFMLIALALLQQKPRTYNLLQRCIMEVHDALYFIVKLRDLVEAYNQLMFLFETDTFGYAQKQFNLKLRVPLLVEATAGFAMGSQVDFYGQSIEEFLTVWRKKHREIESKSWEDMIPIV